ncbi:N-acylglucosamine 2-epimerase [Lichenicola cladoniae]|uniref:N-acylglucosamine 2-epimerase n=1 Tax=Lichenicola cladoniae TaxID=1484109 RepID=A0A6M8H903_9PROT|nr:AGE family epimerase/isomerase [Lichenicola cladoniae]NPD68530.1 N-acylglucosamine 2-epimerase [Acetobacteraceae bacterium]QKE88983.1 N-acylglucosamine 2-epimerase [Lichenicola cladoniae]
MSDTGMLMQAADRIEAWFADTWPVWIERGLDRNGLFYEQFDASGRPDDLAPRRMRVQGRQLYSLSRAVAAGYDSAKPVLDRALVSIEAHCWGAVGNQGWIHLMAPDGTPLDTLRDTYDQAFMLFGLCGASEAGLPYARVLADRTLAFIDAELLDARDGSYREGAPASLPRRANPHMHLFEAMLAWFAHTGERQFLDRANRIAGLFETAFLDRGNGTLTEFFTEDLRPAPTPAGDVVEPGHHFEWSWLLHRLATLGGRDLLDEAGILHRWAVQHGLDHGLLAVDECDRLGRQIRKTRRIWPQTELIKSRLANDEPEIAATVAIAMLDTYLATDTKGMWIDQFDHAGMPCDTVVPASTLYHLVVAFEDLLRVAGRPKRVSSA